MWEFLKKTWSALTSKTADFRCSLKPIIFWFNLFGIHLEVSQKSIPIRLAYGLVGFSALLFNLVIHYLWFYMLTRQIVAEIELLSEDSMEKRKQQLLDTSPLVFRSSMNVVLATGPHLIFFIFTFLTLKWEDLWANLLQIQIQLQLHVMFHKRIR